MKSLVLIVLMFLMPSKVLNQQKTMQHHLEALKLAKPITYKNLTIFPLTLNIRQQTDYATLDQAMKNGWLSIREIGNGEVNFVELKNTGNRVVFIMTGEMISGAKQDRMLRDDVLVPPKSGWIRIPVYCVEHGRWVSVSPAFKSSGLVVPNELRQRARITEDQSQVWDAIASSQDRLGIASRTGTAHANYEDEETAMELKEYSRKFADLPKLTKNVVGVVATTGNRIICVDVFANNDLLMKYWNRLLKSYAMDAMHETKSTIRKDDIQELLDALAHAHYASMGTPGLGDLLKIETDFGKGTVLLDKERLVHMDFFLSNMFTEPEWRLDIRRDQRLND
jgi:hypothetical protein